MTNNYKSLYPSHVINTRGIKIPFKEDKVANILNKETGLDIKDARNISKKVLKKIISMKLTSITTNQIREMICSELTNNDMSKYRNLFARKLHIDDIGFKLDEEFINKYKDNQPSWGEIGYITYKRTYARFIEDENRKEEFWETIKRVVEGCYSLQKEHCKRLGLTWKEDKAQRSAQMMYDLIWNFKFTPAGRGLWMMGTDFIAENGSMSLNNCAFVSTEDIKISGSRPFEFVMDCLMLGVGVGFDVLGAGEIDIQQPSKETDDGTIYIIPDSREGWVESMKLVLNGYFYGDYIPEIEYSQIRPKGTPIRGFGGICSGYKPLKRLHNAIKEIFNKKIGQPLSSVDIVDIMNYIAKCVIAGNVRRSAEISLGDPLDIDFLLCKQDEDALKSHRWASNNSVFAKKGMHYKLIVEQIVKNGEPGIIWLQNGKDYSRMIDPPDYKDKLIKGVNPCGEQSLESYELCNLVETFPSNHNNYMEYQQTLKYAYLYAKSVTLLNTHWEKSNTVMLKNRRIGISQTGIIEAFTKLGRNEVLKWCDKGYNYLRELDEIYSNWLCIPKSIKITTVKPSGTVSLLAGVSAGIHYPHSEYYIRRVRIASNSELKPILEKAGYRIEEDIYSENTLVVEFPIHEKYFKKAKKDVSIWEQVANAIDYQRYWSDNQVSITITFKKEEEKDLISVLEFCEDKLKGLSFLPLKTHGYTQAPYETITKDEYEKMKSKIKEIDELNISEKELGIGFCESDKCEIKY